MTTTDSAALLENRPDETLHAGAAGRKDGTERRYGDPGKARSRGSVRHPDEHPARDREKSKAQVGDLG